MSLVPRRMRRRKKMRLSREEFRNFLRKNPTRAESLLWSVLKHKQIGGSPFIFQHQIFWWVADFAVPEIKFCIEVDGKNHFSDPQKSRDKSRDRFLATQGWTTMRMTNDEVAHELSEVIEAIERIANDVLRRNRGQNEKESNEPSADVSAVKPYMV